MKGGEAFKDSVNKLDLDDRAKSVVLDLLRKHQMMSQDTDIQELIRKMTR